MSTPRNMLSASMLVVADDEDYIESMLVALRA